ncbi:MAG: 30S ribosomal protein S8 [Bryobacterales bacterium]|nr:30S ribosomal protein S8 [Bryobacterales bacterium]MDE0261762.1 30S ribosomal protein S8 [Bryobacterales bacterium]MDE0623905.1 30S ribosomal protein S8 [Bryobacterales bacterium]
MHSDPIADMLTRIRNGMTARHHKVEIPGSKVKIELARILKEEGYVSNYRVATDNNKKTLKVYLKYRPDNRPVITRLTRVSKPSRRVYVDAQHIPRVIGGMGVSVLTTSKGVMTGRQAKGLGIGGEVLCTVY